MAEYGVCAKEYMWKPRWQARQQIEKELEAPSTTASKLGGTRDSRSGSRKEEAAGNRTEAAQVE